MEKDRSIKELLETYRVGDKLTTPELVRLRDHMKELSELSFKCGDIFALQAGYANQVYMNCASFINSRRTTK